MMMMIARPQHHHHLPVTATRKSLENIESSSTISIRSNMPSLTTPLAAGTLPIARARSTRRDVRFSKSYKQLESNRTTSRVSAPSPPSMLLTEGTAQLAGSDIIRGSAQRTRIVRAVTPLNNLRSAAADDSAIASTTYRPRDANCPDINITAPTSPALTDVIELVNHMKRRESVRNENGKSAAVLPVQRKLKASYIINRQLPGLVCGRADCFRDESKKAIARTPQPQKPKVIPDADEDEDRISILSLSV